MSDFDLGYMMGLIVGEGCFTGSGGMAPSLRVHLHADDIEPMKALQDFFGGRIYGPYFSQGRVSRQWVLRGHELYNGLPLIIAAIPPSKKRRQMEAWIEKYCMYSAVEAARRLKGPTVREQVAGYAISLPA